MAATLLAGIRVQLPLLTLLHPRRHTALLAGALAGALLVGALLVRSELLPVWGAAAMVLATLMLAAIPKWRDDRRRYGTSAMLLCILVLAQGFHWVEHVVQWAQYHLLGWELRAAVGILSPANAEWVHFAWNWLVLVSVMVLMRSGMRGGWAWLLLVWASAHTIEHTYLFVRHLELLSALRQMGVSDVTAQGLPGILGQDGWLARSDATRGSFLCTLPGLATAPRLDVHFWWNVGETALLLPAANAYMATIVATARSIHPALTLDRARR
jgi:hypothetical protein